MATRDDDNDQLLTSYDVAALLRMTHKSVENWRQRRQGPPYLKISPHIVRYSRRALQAWIAARVVDVEAGA